MSNRNRNWDKRAAWESDQVNRRSSYGRDLENYGTQENTNYGYDTNLSRTHRFRDRYQQGMYGADQNTYGGDYDDVYAANREWNRNRLAQQEGNYGYGMGEASRYNVKSGNASYGSSMDRGYSGQERGYSGNIYGGDTRNYGNANQGGFDRDWWDKTKDEVSSWFGDDDAERRRRMDKQYATSNKGKGPRGYRRSDERIAEDVNDRLSDDPVIDASDIEVKVENCNVILNGMVESREEKHRAEAIVENVSGVANVENRLRVSNVKSTRETEKLTGQEAGKVRMS